MIWLTWRLNRSALITFTIIFASLSILFVLVGGKMREIADRGIICGTGIDACVGLAPYTTLWLTEPATGILFHALPILLGAFLGAPLIAKEIEQRTFQFSWTQGVNRKSWLLFQTATLAVYVTAVSALFGITYAWWHSQSVPLGSPWERFDFDVATFTSYGLFAFSLGILASAAFQRTLTTIAVSSVVFIFIRIIIEMTARPHYMTPITNPVGDSSSHSGLYVESRQIGEQYLVAQQSNERYHIFQFIECAIFVTLAITCFIAARNLIGNRTR